MSKIENGEEGSLRHVAIEHGTLSGYVQRGCRCEKCRRFYNAYQREWRQTPQGRAYSLRQGRIHSQAKTILKNRHQDEYRQIVAELRAASDYGAKATAVTTSSCADVSGRLRPSEEEA